MTIMFLNFLVVCHILNLLVNLVILCGGDNSSARVSAVCGWICAFSATMDLRSHISRRRTEEHPCTRS